MDVLNKQEQSTAREKGLMECKHFLEYVADDILQKWGDDLTTTAVVFPNKRAALFLNEHLARRAGKPIWSPAYLTISELFEQQSELQIGDPIKLIADLHRSFTTQTGISETLDHFYGWGQLLLADFDDVDKNMANAHQVFANLTNYHEFDDVSYLSPEQTETLRKFFQNFSAEHNSELKKRFLQLWNHFEDIYNDYRQRLADQQLAYEGMLFRHVAEQPTLHLPYDQYLFVGFNMVQRVEQTLFKRLQEQGKARFYWDFDEYYLNDRNEAGHFVRQFLGAFPNELPQHPDIYDNLKNLREINVISAPTENVQARYADTWLRQGTRMADGRKTAIVLCNESLLPTVIHSLPEELAEANITTGYPLTDTPAALLANALLNMRVYPGKSSYRRLMRHVYAPLLGDDFRTIHPEATTLDTIRWVVDTIRQVASRTPLTLEGICNFRHTSPLTSEALFKTYTLLNRLLCLIENGDLSIDVITLQRLVGQLIASTTIPFHGEPVEGIQIMGVLETRNLDFDHLLILSCNEGFMPRGVNDSSFIPHSIRKAFGLTTIDHKVAVYSYYFHRLLQRADDITITYNNSTEDGHTGEMSRFVMQLMVESPHHFVRQAFQTGQTPYIARPSREVVKDEGIMQKLRTFLAPHPSSLIIHPSSPIPHPSSPIPLYPTSINRYLRCPLQFYFNDLMGFREPDAEEEVIDNRSFGNIFHRASEIIYQSSSPHLGGLEGGQKEALLERAVDQAIREELFDHAEQMPELNGLQIINREVIIRYLRRLLEIDAKLGNFTILGTEKKVYGQTTITTSEGTFDIQLCGYIDRLDRIGEDRIRVVDYKTGSRALTKRVNSVEDLFAQPMHRDLHPDYYLQTMLYAHIVRNSPKYNPGNLPVSPALLFIQHATGDNYDPTLSIGQQPISDIKDLDDEFMSRMNQVIAEIFEPQTPFRPTADPDVCATCPFRMMCQL